MKKVCFIVFIGASALFLNACSAKEQTKPQLFEKKCCEREHKAEVLLEKYCCYERAKVDE